MSGQQANRDFPQQQPEDQGKIWEYFQNEAPESFAAARPRLDYLLRQIARRAGGTHPRLLNIGAGSGYLEQQALQRGWQIHSLDPDPRTISRLTDAGVQGHVGAIEQMPLEDEQFDFIVASEVLEHLNDGQRGRGIVEVARVLLPGGWFLGTVPYQEDLAANRVVCPHCGQLFHRWGHQASFTPGSLSAELSACLDVVQVKVTAFVTFRDRKLPGKLKSLLRLILARWGQPIAVPSIYWLARKPQPKPPQ